MTKDGKELSIDVGALGPAAEKAMNEERHEFDRMPREHGGEGGHLEDVDPARGDLD